jgi:hypothetical protein
MLRSMLTIKGQLQHVTINADNPLHIESPYNFGGTGPILGVKNPLQRVNGHAALTWLHVLI